MQPPRHRANPRKGTGSETESALPVVVRPLRIAALDGVLVVHAAIRPYPSRLVAAVHLALRAAVVVLVCAVPSATDAAPPIHFQ